MSDQPPWIGELIDGLRGVDTVGVLCRDKGPAARSFLIGLGLVPRTVLLDPRDGVDRIRGHIARAGIQRLLVDPATYRELAPCLPCGSLPVAEPMPQVGRASDLMAFPIPDAHEYVIFTSGSAGEPGLVVQTVAAAKALARSYLVATGIGRDDVVGVFGTCGHDAFVVDLMSSWVSDCSVSFLDPSSPRLAKELPRLLGERGVTVWHSVPTVWRALIGRLGDSGQQLGLRLVVLGGEAVEPRDLHLVDRCTPGTRVFSLYGQSELSVISGHVLDDERDCGLLGADVVGVETALLRDGAVECSPPERLDGELLVRSRWRATTAGPAEGQPLDGWWRTGDIVRREGGTWRFLGRADDVVTIHGERIGLLELEHVICAVTGARDALMYLVDAGAGRAALGILLDTDDAWSVPGLNAAVRSHMPSGLTVRQVATGSIDSGTGRTGKADRSRQRLIARHRND